MFAFLLVISLLIIAFIFATKSKDNEQNKLIEIKNTTKKPSGLGLYDSEVEKKNNEVANAVKLGEDGKPEPYSSGTTAFMDLASGGGMGGNRYSPGYNMNSQYGFPVPGVRQMHPVLAYQFMHDKAINPANLGDPIRIADVAGAKEDLYGSPKNFLDALTIDKGSVPVPMGALKATNEQYNRDMFRFTPGGLTEGTIARPKNEREPFSIQPVTPPGAPLPSQPGAIPSTNFFRPYGPNVPVEPVPFFGSVNAYAPFPAIETKWEKAGLLTSVDGNRILNLYRRPIAPLQDLWEYQVQDKNGFVIKLENVRYLEDGDSVPFIVGKAGLGPWKVHIFVENKYIMM